MIVYLVGSVSDWPRRGTQTQTLSYHFFFSLLGSVSVFQFGLGEDLRLKLPAFGGKSNCKSSTALHVLIAVGGCIRGNGRFLRTNIDMTIVILKHCDHCS